MNARQGRRGYTVVEVMIAMAILMIGTSGIVAMQKVTVVANRDSKNLVVANQIARRWLERLRADAAKWNHPSAILQTSDMDETQWLKSANVTGLWIRPADSALGSFTADSFGNDVAFDSQAAAFCTNLRLTWLYGPPETVQPPYLVRAEARVFWLRDGGGGMAQTGKALCDPTLNLTTIGAAVTNYHFIYVATAITQNMAR
jgi:prepilin-type N-terminal cleavage/methylation domain-containing protein